MADSAEVTHDQDFEILVDGNALAEEDYNKINLVRVEQVKDGPDFFEIGLWSQKSEGMESEQSAFPLGDKFKLNAEVEIKVGYQGTSEKIIKGLVTGAEVALSEKEHRHYINGFCRLHLLTRGRRTMHWEGMTYSDVASDVASKCGLTPDVEATSDTHDYISMNNQTYLSFLTDLARRIHYEVNVEDKNLLFKKERTSESSALTCVFGGDEGDVTIRRVRISAQSAGQVTKVRVFAWDDAQKTQIIGNYEAVDNSLGGSVTGPDAGKLINKDSEYWITNYAARTQAEVDTVAQAVFQEMANKFVTVEAEVEGNTSIKPGVVITLQNVTPPFEGDYYITRAIHVHKSKSGSGGGYITKFFCCRPSWNG